MHLPLALLSLLSLISATPVRRATTCNGSPSLCSRLYSNVTFAGAHNSYAIAPSAQTNAGANQNVSLTQQLDMGVRMLQSQAHKSGNSSATGAGVDLCHSSCSIFQGGALEYWLSQILTWSRSNPSEVLTLLIVNSDALPASTFASAFESTGLASRMYNPTSAGVGSGGQIARTSWPTLGALIDAGTPVVAFLSSGADTSSVGYLLPQFANVWETPYDQLSVPFNCSIDRIDTASASSSLSLMYLTNAYLDESLLGNIVIPAVGALNDTNGLERQLETAYTCSGMHGNAPNFLLSDYSQTGDYGVLRAAARLNGVEYTPPASTASSGSGGSSGSTSGAAATRSTATMAMTMALGATAAGLAML